MRSRRTWLLLIGLITAAVVAGVLAGALLTDRPEGGDEATTPRSLA